MHRPRPLTRTAAALVVVLASLLAVKADALWLGVSPEYQEADVDTNFSVDILAWDLPADTYISAFNLLLGYDDSLIEPLSVTFTDRLGDLTGNPPDVDTAFQLDFDPVAQAPDQFTDYSGRYNLAINFDNLSFADTSVLQTRQGDQPFSLASIEFHVLGRHPFSETVLELMDDSFYSRPINVDGNFDVKDQTNQVLTSDLRNGTALVPAPPGWLLLLSMLPLLVRFGRRTGPVHSPERASKQPWVAAPRLHVRRRTDRRSTAAVGVLARLCTSER